MGLIREPKNVNFTIQSKPWTEKELCDFRKIMADLKAINSSKKIKVKSINRKTSV